MEWTPRLDRYTYDCRLLWNERLNNHGQMEAYSSYYYYFIYFFFFSYVQCKVSLSTNRLSNIKSIRYEITKLKKSYVSLINKDTRHVTTANFFILMIFMSSDSVQRRSSSCLTCLYSSEVYNCTCLSLNTKAIVDNRQKSMAHFLSTLTN